MPRCINMCVGLYEEGRQSPPCKTVDGKWPSEKKTSVRWSKSAVRREAYHEEKSDSKTATESHSIQTKTVLCINIKQFLHDTLFCL